jgi:hypothetical protein
MCRRLQLKSAGQAANWIGRSDDGQHGGRDFDERCFRLGMRLNF